MVGGDPEAYVADVEGLLAVERGAGVYHCQYFETLCRGMGGGHTSVRNGHFRHGQPVEHAPVIVGKVVDDHALSAVEPNPETPLLPGYLVAIGRE